MSMERDDPRQYHIELAPGRCEMIAACFDEPHLVARHREYETW
jgi:uridine phosphorylase